MKKEVSDKDQIIAKDNENIERLGSIINDHNNQILVTKKEIELQKASINDLHAALSKVSIENSTKEAYIAQCELVIKDSQNEIKLMQERLLVIT